MEMKISQIGVQRALELKEATLQSAENLANNKRFGKGDRQHFTERADEIRQEIAEKTQATQS